MAFSYVGNFPNQQVSNSGVLSLDDINNLESNGELGGSLELIASTSHSGDVSQIDFTDIKAPKYDVHLLQIKDFDFETSIGRIGIQLRESGTWETGTNYMYSIKYLETTGSYGNQRQTAYEYMQLEFQLSTAGTMNCYAYLYGLGDSNKYSFMTYDLHMVGATYGSHRFGGGALTQASAVDGIRIMRSGSSNFTGYNIKLFGVK